MADEEATQTEEAPSTAAWVESQSDAMSEVRAIDPDILGVVEGPDTTASGTKSASAQLEVWAALHGLHSSYRAIHGFPSGGRQEL